MFLIFIPFIVAVTEACRCGDYKTQAGCNNFANNCVWKNGNCNEIVAQCKQLTQSSCISPDCVWNTQLQVQVCQPFTTCSNLPQYSACSSYGCLQNGYFCQNFTSCSALSQAQCNYFQIGNGSFCNYVADSSKTYSCQMFQDCASTPIDYCSQIKFCKVPTNTTKCVDRVCQDQTTSDTCFQYICTWIKEGNSTDVNKGHCNDNNCQLYNTEYLCNQNTNREFCAWGGSSCNRCSDSYGTLIGVLALLVLVI